MDAIDIEQKRQERIHSRVLADGRALWLVPLMFTYRLAIGPEHADGYDDSWCYATRAAGLEAWLTWDPADPTTPEPAGWVRHPESGRRRPDGDPDQEYVNL